MEDKQKDDIRRTINLLRASVVDLNFEIDNLEDILNPPPEEEEEEIPL
jgi:hypothetical protein